MPEYRAQTIGNHEKRARPDAFLTYDETYGRDFTNEPLYERNVGSAAFEDLSVRTRVLEEEVDPDNPADVDFLVLHTGDAYDND